MFLSLSKGPHLLIPSHWALGFQHINLAGDTNIQNVAYVKVICEPDLLSGKTVNFLMKKALLTPLYPMVSSMLLAHITA